MSGDVGFGLAKPLEILKGFAFACLVYGNNAVFEFFSVGLFD
jgi:hypothetical protein